MLLMDSIAATAQQAREAGLADHPTLKLYVQLDEKIKPKIGPEPPRFVLDEKATIVASELSVGRPKVLCDIVHRTIFPYPAMWIEWDDNGRKIFRERFRQDEALDELRPYPSRMGFFVEVDPETLRRGTITWAWAAKPPNDDIPNVSPVSAEFDLDADFGLDPQLDRYPLTLAEPWKENPEQYNALYAIWRTVRHHLDTKAFPTVDEFDRALAFADVVGEYLMVFMATLLLTSARKAVELRPVDLTRLNKARAKSKKTLLRNHQIVHVYLGNREQNSNPVMARGPLAQARKSPRVHLVSSYPAVRHGKPIIVFSYPRGWGRTGVSRTTHIHG